MHEQSTVVRLGAALGSGCTSVHVAAAPHTSSASEQFRGRTWSLKMVRSAEAQAAGATTRRPRTFSGAVTAAASTLMSAPPCSASHAGSSVSSSAWKAAAASADVSET